jgi:hypothetical protein
MTNTTLEKQRTDRSEAYNKVNGTAICNNGMLDRYLRNKAELEKMKAQPVSKTVFSTAGKETNG